MIRAALLFTLLTAGVAHAQSTTGATAAIPFQPGETPCWVSYAGDIGPCHQVASLTAPTVAAGAAAGTTPTVAISAGTDNSMGLSVTTGTAPTASAILATVTLGTPRLLVPHCALTATNLAAAGVALPYLTKATTGVLTVTTGALSGATTVALNIGATSLAASTAYTWDLVCGP